MTKKNLIAPGWPDYQLLDTGNYQKLERFGKHLLIRPEKQASWQKSQPALWSKANAVFKADGGWQLLNNWQGEARDDLRDESSKKNLTEFKNGGDLKNENKREQKTGFSSNQVNQLHWPIHWQNLTFNLSLHPFGHLGVFPEQSAHWQWLADYFANIPPSQLPTIKILNLFAYTGVVSLLCASAGVKITHVDSSASAIKIAKDNQRLSGLSEQSIRWILDDARKFVQREINRGNQYHGIILDPPAFGHGAKGEKWSFKQDFAHLFANCLQILLPKKSFFLLNSYATGVTDKQLSGQVEAVLGAQKRLMKLEYGELFLKADANQLLSTGVWVRGVG